MNNEIPMPKKFRDTEYVLQAKTLVCVDPEDGENFYSYDVVPVTEEYRKKYTSQSPMEINVAINADSTKEFHEMVVGQKFVLDFAGPQA